MTDEVPLPFDRLPLKEQIRQVREAQVGKQMVEDQKGFKLPFGIRFSGMGAVKKGKVLVCYLQKNKRAKFFWSKIVNGMVQVGDMVHNAAPGFLFSYGRFPLLVVQSWKVNPVASVDFTDETAPQEILVRKLESAELVGGKKFGGVGAIWILIGLAAGAYLLFGGGAG